MLRASVRADICRIVVDGRIVTSGVKLDCSEDIPLSCPGSFVAGLHASLSAIVVVEIRKSTGGYAPCRTSP